MNVGDGSGEDEAADSTGTRTGADRNVCSRLSGPNSDSWDAYRSRGSGGVTAFARRHIRSSTALETLHATDSATSVTVTAKAAV